MRKIILKIFIAIFAITANLYSQNNIDPAKLPGINFNDNTVFKKQFNKFIIGYNYGDTGRALDSLLSANYYLYGWETGTTVNWNWYGNNTDYYLRIRPLGWNDDHGVGACQAVYYEPSITVNKNENFTPDPNSTGGAIFGFQNKNYLLLCCNLFDI
jgi:hypothetical protein